MDFGGFGMGIVSRPGLSSGYDVVDGLLPQSASTNVVSQLERL